MNSKRKRKPVELKNSDDYFDDCYICQEVKKLEEKGKSPNLSELTEIFEKANKLN